jgi:hypothetical protein
MHALANAGRDDVEPTIAALANFLPLPSGIGHFSSGYCMVTSPVALMSIKERGVLIFLGKSRPMIVATMCLSVIHKPPTMEGR